MVALVGKDLSSNLLPWHAILEAAGKQRSFDPFKCQADAKGRWSWGSVGGLHSNLRPAPSSEGPQAYCWDCLPSVQMWGPGVHQVGKADGQISCGNHEIGPDGGEWGFFQHGEQKAKLGVTESGTRGRGRIIREAVSCSSSPRRCHPPIPGLPDHTELAERQRSSRNEVWVAVEARVVADFEQKWDEGSQHLLACWKHSSE